jgi:hypothetical protein
LDGTLERIVARTPYVIVYRIDLGDEDELIVLRVYHAAPGPVGGRGLASAWFCCPAIATQPKR